MQTGFNIRTAAASKVQTTDDYDSHFFVLHGRNQQYFTFMTAAAAR
jgi:hypothetical protein